MSSDMVSGMASALVQNLTASMDPSRKVIIDQLTEMGKAAALDNESRKGTILDELYAKHEKLQSAEPKNIALLDSIMRRIKRIEEI